MNIKNLKIKMKKKISTENPKVKNNISDIGTNYMSINLQKFSMTKISNSNNNKNFNNNNTNSNSNSNINVVNSSIQLNLKNVDNTESSK